MSNYSFVKIIALLLFFSFLTACQSGRDNGSSEKNTPIVLTPTASTLKMSATPDKISPVATPVSPLATNTPVTVVIPTPGKGVGTIHGVMVNSTNLPLAGLSVYLGTFDGTLIEISLNHSPKAMTDGDGRFIFTDVLPNDKTFQYAIGIIIGNDNGTIISNPDGEGDLIFDVAPGEVLDLGVLDSGLQ